MKSKDIRGGWSEPVYLNSSGFDPSVFHDTDGKMYIVNMINNFKGILVQEYDPVQECLVGEGRMFFRELEEVIQRDLIFIILENIIIC